MTDAAQNFSTEVLLRAQGQGLGMRAAIFDVDGVMTDGRLYIHRTGETFKAFHVLDGHGLKLLASVGITPIVISGRDSPALRRRIKDLGLVHACYGITDKLTAAERLLAELGVAWPDVAVIGDDWPDLPLLHRAGFACAPPQAHVEVRAVAHHITQARGGEGAVREFCDVLLMAGGHYGGLLQHQRQSLDTR